MDAKTKKITRRRFLSVCAVAGICSAMPLSHAFSSVPLHRWNGILLGANVGLSIAHPSRNEAHRIFDLCVTEIKRLENIFTLYDSHSELSRLNVDGVLQNPSSELVDILEQSRLYHDMTGGAFDVTVKALEEGKSIDLVGMNKLHVGQKEIRFEKKGMGVTLNGIAQGYITDRITELLKAEGLKNVLVELGEKRTLGSHPSGRPWNLALEGHKNPVSLVDKALATSARKNGDTGQNHIFKPSDGKFSQQHETISIVAKTATIADALSTGFMSLEQSKIKAIEKRYSSILKTYIS